MGHRTLLAASVVVLVAPALVAPAIAWAQPYHFEDTLRGATTGNRTGGTLGADGWTVTGVDDAIWYALPRLESGYVEFTIAHVTLANLPLGDQEIFAMYEDGWGLGEPIDYGGGFRSNFYKVLVRIYGTPEPSRAGFMKMMWGICPSGAPGQGTCGCGSFFEEPFADPGAWTGDPVRMRIEWGGGHSRLLRDGAEVVSVDWTGFEFGPSELHMMLGSPRNDGGLSSMPIGATFSDLVVDGVEGPLAVCPGAPDAGMPVDAGGGCAGGGATQDATAASWVSGVFPDASDLNVEGDGSAPSGIVYLRFPATGAPGDVTTSAVLTMHTSPSGSAGGGSGRICAVTGGTWDEATLTWTSRPTVSTSCVGPVRTVTPDMAVTWDVTSIAVAGAPVDLAVVSTDADGAHYLSRESGGCASGPTLAMTTAPGPDTGMPGHDAGATGTDAGATGMDAATTGMDASASGTDAGRGGGGLAAGCGCRAGTGSSTLTPTVLALSVLALLALVTTRRRR